MATHEGCDPFTGSHLAATVRHLLGRYQDQSLEQQRETQRLIGKLGLDRTPCHRADLPAGCVPAYVHLCWNEVQAPLSFGCGVVHGTCPSLSRDCKAAAVRKFSSTVSTWADSSNFTIFTNYGATMPGAASKGLSCMAHLMFVGSNARSCCIRPNASVSAKLWRQGVSQPGSAHP